MNHPTLPTIHSNGNAGETLLSQYEEAHTASSRFMDEWAKIEFNPRDYYVNGDGAYSEALAARQRIDSHIRAIREYLTLHIEHIFNQLPQSKS